MDYTSGIFIRDVIRCSFGRRQCFLIEYILQKTKQEALQNEDRFIFISEIELWHLTGCTIKRTIDSLRFLVEHTVMSIKESDEPKGLLIRTTEKEIFNVIIPKHLDNMNKSMDLNNLPVEFRYSFSPRRTRNGQSHCNKN